MGEGRGQGSAGDQVSIWEEMGECLPRTHTGEVVEREGGVRSLQPPLLRLWRGRGKCCRFAHHDQLSGRGRGNISLQPTMMKVDERDSHRASESVSFIHALMRITFTWTLTFT